MPSKAGGRTFLDRQPAGRTSAPEDDFPALSDEEWEDLEHRAGQRARPGSREWNAEAARQRDEMRHADAEENGPEPATSPRSPGRGRSGNVRRAARSASSAASSAQAAGKTTSGATFSLLSGKRPASIAAGVLGMIGYAVVSNFASGGWPQVKGWAGAKFLNKPYTPAPAAPSAAAGSPPPAAAAAAIYAFPSGTVVAPAAPGSVA